MKRKYVFFERLGVIIVWQFYRFSFTKIGNVWQLTYDPQYKTHGCGEID